MGCAAQISVLIMFVVIVATRPHTNFMCKDSDEGAVVICVARDEVEAEHGTAAPPPQVAQRKKAGAKPLKKYRVLIRTPKVRSKR
jgi:hypothetical protein